MNKTLIAITLVLAGSTATAQDGTGFVVEEHPFRVHSAFWPNLHHLLYAEAWARRPPGRKAAGPLPEPLIGDLTEKERQAWEAAVSYYDAAIADMHLLFEMGPIRQRLITAGDDLPAMGLDPAHRAVLAGAAPVYRKYWWPAHDRANRTWLADTLAKVTSLSPAVPDRLAQIYGSSWLTKGVRVDVVRVGAREGAYTARDPQPGHITLSSGNAASQGWMAAEILFHESSHLLADPIREAFNNELRAQGKLVTDGRIGTRTDDLWHAALFYLTGEVVRQALSARGIAHEPYLYKTGLFDRAWPHHKAPIERYGKAYVDGRMSRDDAIRNIVAAIGK